LVSKFPYRTYFNTVYQKIPHTNSLQFNHLAVDGTEHQSDFPLAPLVESDGVPKPTFIMKAPQGHRSCQARLNLDSGLKLTRGRRGHYFIQCDVVLLFDLVAWMRDPVYQLAISREQYDSRTVEV